MRRHNSLGLQGQKARGNREQQAAPNEGRKVDPLAAGSRRTYKLRPSPPIVAMLEPMAALGSGPVPSTCADTILVIKDGCLCDIDKVREKRCDASDNGHQNPALNRVQPYQQAAPDIFSTA